MSKFRLISRLKLAILIILLFVFTTTVFAQNYYVDILARVHMTGLFIGGVQVTSSAAELNVLDGIPGTLTAGELGILDGVTTSAAELNVLDGIPAGLTAAELGILDGVTSTTAEINVLAGIPVGLTAAELGVLDGIAAGLTAAELSILDGVTATTAELNVLDGIAAGLTAAELSILDGLTATTAELNLLAGVPAGLTTTEIGYLDGVTSGIQGQIDAAGVDLPGFLHGVTLSFTDNSANYSVQSTITDHEMILGIRNTVSGVVTWCTSTTAKTGAIGGIAADTTYYVHAAPNAGDFTITVNTTSTETGDDFIIGIYCTEESAAEIAYSEVYGPVVEADARLKIYCSGITYTRTAAVASGDVEYAGVPFKPKGIQVFGSNPGFDEASFGFADVVGNTAGWTNFKYGNTTWGANIDVIVVMSDGTNSQNAVVSTWNNDGVTLTWTKTGTGIPSEISILFFG